VVSNANNSTTNGTIHIDVRRARAHADDSPPAEGIEILITDTGTGMTEEEKRTALTSFGQILQRTSDTPQNGTGLGLPISAGFMQLMGGKIDLDSRKEVGTTVRLWLPSQAIVRAEPTVYRDAGRARSEHSATAASWS